MTDIKERDQNQNELYEMSICKIVQCQVQLAGIFKKQWHGKTGQKPPVYKYRTFRVPSYFEILNLLKQLATSVTAIQLRVKGL